MTRQNAPGGGWSNECGPQVAGGGRGRGKSEPGTHRQHHPGDDKAEHPRTGQQLDPDYRSSDDTRQRPGDQQQSEPAAGLALPPIPVQGTGTYRGRGGMSLPAGRLCVWPGLCAGGPGSVMPGPPPRRGRVGGPPGRWGVVPWYEARAGAWWLGVLCGRQALVVACMAVNLGLVDWGCGPVIAERSTRWSGVGPGHRRPGCPIRYDTFLCHGCANHDNQTPASRRAGKCRVWGSAGAGADYPGDGRS
jgi:hypothetical protein